MLNLSHGLSCSLPWSVCMLCILISLYNFSNSENSLLSAVIILPRKPNNMPTIQREVIGIKIWAVTSCTSLSGWFSSPTLCSCFAMNLQSADTRSPSGSARIKIRSCEWFGFLGPAGASQETTGACALQSPPSWDFGSLPDVRAKSVLPEDVSQTLRLWAV